MDYDEIKLEPLRFLSDTLTKPWGSEEYKFADLGPIDSMAAEGFLGGNTISDIMQTYLERISGENAFDAYGTQFPVMVKLLDVKGRTSLHVNADDETGEQRYDAFGKTALWYVLEADKDSRLYLGFRRDVTPTEFYEKCLDGTVDTLLKEVRPVKGQAYLVPPGIVHAAKGVKLLEIAESSELWFRLYDWAEEPREMQVEEAFDIVNYNASDSLEVNLPLSTPQMSIRSLSVIAPSSVESPDGDTFRLYVCLKGELQVSGCHISEGGVALVPADLLTWTLTPGKEGADLLEVTIDKIPQPEEPWQKSE